MQKGCPFCGNTNLVSEYNPTQNETKIACTDCEYFITFKKAPPIYTPYLAEFVWNSGADEAKPTESTAEAILSELKDIKSYVAELAGYSLEK